MTRFIFIIAIFVSALASVVPRTSGQVNVTQKNNNASRDGHYIDPAFTPGNAANLVRDLNFDGTIVGNVHENHAGWRDARLQGGIERSDCRDTVI